MKLLLFLSLILPLVLTNYNYLLYTTFWPPAITHLKLSSKIDYFTVHGIWPEYYNGTWPQYCNISQPFNATAIADLKYILKYIWYDYNNQDPDLFWKHEWDKHGTCCEDIFHDERGYFIQAIIWHSKYQILDALEEFDIYANNSYYNEQLMEDALHYKYGYKVRLMCHKNGLNSIEMCFSKNLKQMNCLRESDCPRDIYFKKNE